MTTDLAIPYAGVCIGCGYDLRGLAADGACPECGMTIARSKATRGFRHANHRWLQKMRLGAWLFLGASLLIRVGKILPIVEAWLFYTWGPYWLGNYLDWQLGHLLPVYFEAVRVSAVWLLTSREPGQQRADSPKMSRLWARWLTVIDYIAVLALTGLGPFLDAATMSPVRTWTRWLNYFATTSGAICLLVMMQGYAMRIGDTKTAGRLSWAAIVGCVAAVCSLATWLAIMVGSRSLYGYLNILMVATAWVYWCAKAWAVVWFAIGIGRTVRHERPTLRLSKMLIYVLAALVLGGIAGRLAGEVLYIQAQRVPETELGALLTRMGGEMWRMGMLVGVALLPYRIAIFHRGLSRWRGSAGTAHDSLES